MKIIGASTTDGPCVDSREGKLYNGGRSMLNIKLYIVKDIAESGIYLPTPENLLSGVT